jgi:hypothetical protein
MLRIAERKLTTKDTKGHEVERIGEFCADVGMLRTVASGEETKGPSTPRLRRSAQDDTI